MNYTQLVIIALISCLILDFVTKQKLIFRPKFWILMLFVVILQTIFDNYLNGRWFANEPIVGPYDKNVYSGINIWHTPLENYFFGIALIYLNVIIYESFLKIAKTNKNK
jgi:lycopene cyclase domain-containing protein